MQQWRSKGCRGLGGGGGAGAGVSERLPIRFMKRRLRRQHPSCYSLLTPTLTPLQSPPGAHYLSLGMTPKPQAPSLVPKEAEEGSMPAERAAREGGRHGGGPAASEQCIPAVASACSAPRHLPACIPFDGGGETPARWRVLTR